MKHSNSILRRCFGLLGFAFFSATAIRADDGSDLWSFQPLPQMHQLITTAPDSGIQSIDRYIQKKLDGQKLTTSPREADHRQVRRLSLLLIGLPPDPAKVQEFVDDPSDENYVRLVDHYLNSPHFGERWARHWMDVVRFAETYGYEWNFLIRDAWRYRDYLIRAFNQDVPYDQLIREHIAGDLLPDGRINESLGINESVIGTAFFRLGETGHDDCKEYPDISLDVLDNQIDTLSKAFQALTVSCARCHDHKLDEITQEDYYALLGILSSSKQVIHTLDVPHRQADIKQELLHLKAQIRQELGRQWLQESEEITVDRLDAAITLLSKEAEDGKPASREVLADIEHPLFVWQKMAQLDEGKSWRQQWVEIRRQYQQEQARRVAFNRDHFTVFADFSNDRNDGWSFAGNAVGQGFARAGDFSVLYQGDMVLDQVLPAGFYSHTVSQKLNATVRSPLLPHDKKYVSYHVTGHNKSACRTIIDNCQLPYFHTQWLEKPAFSWIRTESAANAKHHAYLEWVTLFDNLAFPNLDTPGSEYRDALSNPRSYFGITKVLLHDVAEVPLEELAAPLMLVESPCDSRPSLAHRYRDLLQTAITSWSTDQSSQTDVVWINLFSGVQCLSRRHDAHQRLRELVLQYRSLEAKLQLPQLIVGMADQGAGFDVPIFTGGDPAQPEDLAKRRYLSCLQDIVKTPASGGGSGRAMVAESIAHPDNPLTARVMVNRIWHHLFGTGLVKSVDNFGQFGDTPSHPELLDYLARQFIDSGWSIKQLIREIVRSDTFRQSSTLVDAAAEVDPENTLLHCFPARRLEAEAIRDSILSVSGRLDRTMYGPSIDPYREQEIDSRRLYCGPLDGAGRRSLYLKVTRMGPSKLLALFNFPEPGMTTGRRDTTNVPTQALGLLNHPFVHQQAERHARKLLEKPPPGIEGYFNRLYITLVGREPTITEIKRCQDFFDELRVAQGVSADLALHDVGLWKEFIHAMYNLKEFIYVL